MTAEYPRASGLRGSGMASNHSAQDDQRATLPLFLVAAGVYVQRYGNMLILERAVGTMIGFWSMPGGLVEAGETPQAAAQRELYEETGLRPTSPLHLIGTTTMHVYGYDCIRLLYACDASAGEVVLSHEHSGAQWIDPVEYRRTHLSEAHIAAWRQRSEQEATMARAVRDTLDDYIAWRQQRLS